MTTYKTANTNRELLQILALQKKNLPENISKEEMSSQGFVTVKHTFDLLAEMNHPFPHIIAKEKDDVIAYALVMLPSFSKKIKVLEPMFLEFNKITLLGKKLSKHNYFVMGQICIDKPFRGIGVFKNLYAQMRTKMSKHFDYVVTEVDQTNSRSLKAHYQIGFKRYREYQSLDGKVWIILIWDWH